MAKDDIYTHLITTFQKFHEQGFLLALVYTKAFDCLDPNVTKELLLAFGRDASLVEFIHTVWNNQCRFVCWKNHVHHTPLRGPAQPQGDPLGPLIMSLWVLIGFKAVQQVVPRENSSTMLYLDDRTVICSSPEDLRFHWEKWVGHLELVSLSPSIKQSLLPLNLDVMNSWPQSFNRMQFRLRPLY